MFNMLQNTDLSEESPDDHMSADVTDMFVEGDSSEMPSPSPQPRREDARKMLCPSRKRLPSLETQRISCVVEDCIARVEMVAVLSAVVSRLEGLSSELDAEITAALRQHRHLEWKLEGPECATNQDFGESGEDGEVDGTRENRRAQLERALQGSLRNVLRLLRASPGAEHVLKVEADKRGGRSKAVRCLLEGLRELHGFVVERLLTSARDEQVHGQYFTEKSSQHERNLKSVASLEVQVAVAIEDKNAEMAKKNEVIRSLMTSLQCEERSAEDAVSQTQQDAEKQSESDTKTSEGKQTQMQQKNNQLKLQLNGLLLENWEAETTLRKKKYKVETEIENWIQKYDADMGEKQLELEEMEAVYEEEKAERAELEEAFAVLELEYSQIREERRLEEERLEEERRDLDFMTRASVVIQAWWRGYRVRKAMKGKSKGKKGKKGKGKKGK